MCALFVFMTLQLLRNGKRVGPSVRSGSSVVEASFCVKIDAEVFVIKNGGSVVGGGGGGWWHGGGGCHIRALVDAGCHFCVASTGFSIQ